MRLSWKRSACALGPTLLTAASLAGCGGGSDDLSRREAVRKVNALCRESGARTSKIVAASDPRSDESFLNTIRGQAKEKARLQDDLEKLSLGGESASVGAYVDAHGKEAAAAQKLVDAIDRTRSLKGESKTALAAQTRARDEAVTKADRAGLRDCGPRVRDAENATTPVGPGTEPRRAPGAILPGSAFVGTWEGTAVQIEPGKDSRAYPVYMRIDPETKADGGNGGVRYDSFDCLGRVKIYEAAPGPDGFGWRYRLQENILTNRDTCGPGGKITAVTQGDELDWRWKRGDVQVVAILRLRGAPRRAEVSKDAMLLLQGHDFGGQVTQYGPGDKKSTFEARFGLWPPGDKRAGTEGDGYTQYSEPPCTGKVTFVSAEGDRATFHEDITDGQNCITGGIIETRRIGDKLLFRWEPTKKPGDDPSSADFALAIGTLKDEDRPDGEVVGPAPG